MNVFHDISTGKDLDVLGKEFQSLIAELQLLRRACTSLPLNFYILNTLNSRGIFASTALLKRINLLSADSVDLHQVILDLISPQDRDLFAMRIESLDSFHGAKLSLELDVLFPTNGWHRIICQMIRLTNKAFPAVLIVFEERPAFVDAFNDLSQNTPVQLTIRESKLLLLVSRGLTNKEISVELDIAVSSAETYRKRLLEKTNCRNSAALVTWGFCNGHLSKV